MALATLTEHSGAVLAFKKRPRGPSAAQAQIDFSPLADMLFQLLAFFLMTIKLANQETLDVPMLAQGIGVDENQATVVTILAPRDGNTEPLIFLGDWSGPPLTLEQVRDEINSRAQSKLIIKAERLVPCGTVLRISRTAVLANKELYIAVRDEE